MKMTKPTPFTIAVPDDLLNFVSQRVSTARLPPGLDLPKGEEWSYGAPRSTIESLRDYWVQKYDWRAVEAHINGKLKMFTIPIEEAGEELVVHFVHHRSEREGAVPLLFLHGWPGSFLEVEPIIDLLTSPKEPGQQAYHVIAPSLPGFAFSSGAKKPGFGLKQMAAVNNKLMLALGYPKYMAQGGDWGSMIARLIGIDFPEHCVGVHVNMVVATPPSPLWHPIQLGKLVVRWLNLYEKALLTRVMWWMKDEMGYLEIQGTKPQTVSYALTDSPLGMLAWIRDKIEQVVDDDFKWDDETVITWAMMYIIPGTSSHAEIYSNAKKASSTLEQDLFDKTIDSRVAFGASIFPKDAFYAPRWWANCKVAKNIVFWKEHDKGGHFPASEKPAELVEDIREFTKVVGAKSFAGLVESGH